MEEFTGECLCAAMRYKISGLQQGVFFCHCSRCRKETGTNHGANAFIGNASLSWERGEENYAHFQLNGTRKARAFCKVCGSAMPRKEGENMVVLPVGSLDPDCEIVPTAHIHWSSRASWEDVALKLKKFDDLPEIK